MLQTDFGVLVRDVPLRQFKHEGTLRKKKCYTPTNPTSDKKGIN